jgi:hypothetical protein
MWQQLWLSYARQDKRVRQVVEEIWLHVSRDYDHAVPPPTITKVTVTNAFKDQPDQGRGWDRLY